MSYHAGNAAFRVDHIMADDSLLVLSNDNAPALGMLDTLDALSRRVIALARVEAARSHPAQGPWARLCRWFLGENEAPRPLANARLDLLRRFATAVWHGDSQSETLAQTLLGKGHYDAQQLDMARRLSRA